VGLVACQAGIATSRGKEDVLAAAAGLATDDASLFEATDNLAGQSPEVSRYRTVEDVLDGCCVGAKFAPLEQVVQDRVLNFPDLQSGLLGLGGRYALLQAL
jgi:hypothetical protein